MKCFVVVILTIVTVVSAEAPNYYTQYRAAPYLESGWRPSGPEFRLPSRQIAQPEYLQPPPVYGPPSQTFRPPQDIITTELPETTTELITTTEISTEKESEQLNEVKENEKLTEADAALTQQGIYYIYHPSGLLQRVVYSTKDDQKNMAYTAQLKYQDVEPIREPIFTYDPSTFVFQRLQF